MNGKSRDVGLTTSTVGPKIGKALQVEREQLEYVRLIGAAVIVGVFGALANLGFRWLIAQSTWLFQALERQQLGIPLPLVFLSGAIPLLTLHYLFPGEVLGYGFPEFLASIHLGGGKLPARSIFVKAAAAAVSLGAGASVGREGPVAQVGGSLGATLARLLGLDQNRAKVLIACGAGATIATTFNAPIGGLLFAQEIILLGDMELANLTLLIIATTSAVVTSRAILGGATVFKVQTFEFVRNIELVTYATMGLVMGGLAAGFIKLFHWVAQVFRRSGYPLALRLCVGLLIGGLIATVVPENLSDGYPVINLALAGKLLPQRMAMLAIAKILSCPLALGSGVPGGIFGPIFYIGTMVGGMFRGVSTMLAPGLTGPRGSYALVGLGTFLTATTHAPLTAAFLLFEMTHSYTIALPILISSTLALLVSRMLQRESLDTYALALEGKSLAIGRERLIMRQIPVSDVMSSNVPVVSDKLSLPDVLRLAGEVPVSSLPVVDNRGSLVGVIVVRDLLALLSLGVDLGTLINAHDLCRAQAQAVIPSSNLDEALQMMNAEGLDELPVIEDTRNRRYLGLVTRHAIAQAASRAAISLSAMSLTDVEIPWSSGYRAIRLTVPRAASGKTLRELQPRAKFGVSVLAIRDASKPTEGFTLADPDRPLNEGDVLIVAAARPSALRLFQRELESIGQTPTAAGS